MTKKKKKISGQETKHSGINSPSAKSHMDRNKFMASVGFPLKKVYLSKDSLIKLADISKSRFNEKLNVEEINTELLSDLISLCINKCYNMKNFLPSEEKTLDILFSPKTIEGLTLIKYHQMAMHLSDTSPKESDRDSERIAKAFNNAKLRVPYTESIANYISTYHSDKTPLQTGKIWLSRDIQAILNRKKINEYIKLLNEQVEWK